MINFINSDKDPAEPIETTPPGFPDLPPVPAPPSPTPPSPGTPPPELTMPDMPELTWDDYLMIDGLEEVEPVSDLEDIPTTPRRSPPMTTPPAIVIDSSNSSASDDSGRISPAEPESSMEYQIRRRNWISKEKVQGNGACPVENIGHMLSLIPNYFRP